MSVKRFVKGIPVPICGLSLGLASLDRFLLEHYGDMYTVSICAFLSLIIAALFTIRIIIDGEGIRKDIENPAVFAVLPTYTMTLMLLSAHAGQYIGVIAQGIWISAIAASFVIMFFFIKRFLINFRIENVFPSWVIIFVGYVVASVTSPAFGMEWLGRLLFWSGFIGYLSILPIAAYRTLFVRAIPESLIPQAAIFTAPVNLCIVGCLAVYGNAPPEAVLAFLVVLSVVSYAAVIAYLPKMLNRRFYPSYAALTFPLVISAASFYELGKHYDLSGDVFHIAQTATALIAVVIVAYVLIRYSVFLYRTAKPAGTARSA
ncbi:MAG: TDT family transporter [Methanomassiliicoccaceae archaeon]|nr:TDT family transporter [Methanomassiliicoccaceae archaeon]